MMPEPKPSVGRILHYYTTADSDAVPALVTRVIENNIVHLAVLDPEGGLSFIGPVEQGSDIGNWAWPNMVQ